MLCNESWLSYSNHPCNNNHPVLQYRINNETNALTVRSPPTNCLLVQLFIDLSIPVRVVVVVGGSSLHNITPFKLYTSRSV